MQQTWLGDKNLAIFCIIAMSQWQFTGYITLLMVVAFQNVSRDYIEAAVIDGAGPIRRAVSIILPLAKEQLIVCSIITVIGAFKLFTEVYSTTVGGILEMLPRYLAYSCIRTHSYMMIWVWLLQLVFFILSLP